MADIDLMDPQDQALGAIGGAVQGFAKGMMDAEDRSYKKMEMDAKFKAQDEERARNAYSQALEQKRFEQTQTQFDYQKQKDAQAEEAALREKGFVRNPETNQIEDAPLTERQRQKQLFEESKEGLVEQRDASGKLIGYKLDPNSRKALESQAKIDTAKALNEARNQRATMMQDRLEEQRNKNASQAGLEFEHDKIISLSKSNLNALKRSRSILDNPNKPVTSKDLNLAYTDYINAVAAGGAATEGKIQRELPETWATSFNELAQKAGSNQDLRKSSAGLQLINMLKANLVTVNEDMEKAVADQAYSLHNSFSANTNPKVRQTIKEKLLQYAPQTYSEIYGHEENKSNPQGLISSGLVSPGPNGLVRAKVKVSDGKETRLIDPTDLSEAMKDGFKRVD